ncbi:hypothetical protein ACQU0X_08365 [Pseudovibrio ascidiaceicola]|uniref:hypothetical protein n=1 Tax=Pseudovibrio ascidiaceicola TaxID=285279 RepID=UPI003D3608FA
MKIHPDDLNLIPAKAAATSTMAVIDAVQDYPPAVQIIAVVAAFKLMIERFNMNAQDAFTVADNIMNHAQGRRVEFEAVQAYLENEL